MSLQASNQPFILLKHKSPVVVVNLISYRSLLIPPEIILKTFVMRIILFLFLISPFVCHAQINRSANELAHEKVQAYITSKLFKTGSYKSFSYGELKPEKGNRAGIAWTIEHKFEIAATTEASPKNSTDVQQPYKFIFYLDKKLKVLQAENVQ
jgi:hypothetical protein